MNTYMLVKAIHILAAIALVGPLALAARWLPLSREAAPKQMLNELHLQTNIAGWLVLITGGAMLYVSGWAFLSLAWMQISIGLFVFVQVFDHFWAELFSRPMACMRTSPLAKSYGWGLHFNGESKVALVAIESAEYQRLSGNSAINQARAMRSKRA
jgi:uncharacterized membrane protein